MKLTKQQLKARNDKILRMHAKGEKTKDIANFFNVSKDTILRVIRENEETEVEQIRKMPKPNLFIGQEVILEESHRTMKKTYKTRKVYKVTGIYPHHVMFQRKGENDTPVTVDYTYQDLVQILILKRISQAAG